MEYHLGTTLGNFFLYIEEIYVSIEKAEGFISSHIQVCVTEPFINMQTYE